LREISSRVRSILAGPYEADLRKAAAELGIAEPDLRTLIELRVPPLRADVLVDLLTKVVRRFGVDPAWLVTGRYDLWSHTEAEGLQADARGLRDQIERLLKESQTDRAVEIELAAGADREAVAVDETSRPPREPADVPTWRHPADASDQPSDAHRERAP
jgi:DNA-binding Lrp family transcriptional regulator